jgi:hypothetical protein
LPVPAGQKNHQKDVGIALRLRRGEGDGLTFSVLHCGSEIAVARFVPVWDGLPRLASYEHGPAYPHSRINLGRLEPLAAQEITRMLGGSPEEQITAWAGGFVDLPASGAGRRGRSRTSPATNIVETRQALAEKHRTSALQKRIERARKRGFLVGDEFTGSAKALLARVDDAKRDVMKLLATQATAEVADLVDELDAPIHEINAALADLAYEGMVSLSASDEAFRDLTGFTYSSVSARRPK